MPFGGANGSRSPETITLTVKARGEFDMTTVTGVDVTTTYPSGRTEAWSWAMTSAAVKALTVTHAFSSDGSEAREVGNYVFSGWLVAGTSRRRFDAKTVPFKGYP